MVRIRLGKQQLRAVWHAHAGGLRQHRDVLADEILIRRRVAAAGALPLREYKRGLRQRVELRPVEPHGGVLFQCGHERIGNTVQHENLLLADAKQVVVVGGALHDTSCGAVDVGGGVH